MKDNKMMNITLYGISDMEKFFNTIDSCTGSVFVDFEDMICDLKGNQMLRRLMMKTPHDFRGVLKLCCSAEDVAKIFGFMQLGRAA